MLEFLSTPAGRAVLGVFIAVVVLALLDLNYRFFAKALLDFLFALTVVIILSPLLVTLAVISRVKAGKPAFTRAFTASGTRNGESMNTTVSANKKKSCAFATPL